MVHGRLWPVDIKKRVDQLQQLCLDSKQIQIPLMTANGPQQNSKKNNRSEEIVCFWADDDGYGKQLGWSLYTK